MTTMPTATYAACLARRLLFATGNGLSPTSWSVVTPSACASRASVSVLQLARLPLSSFEIAAGERPVARARSIGRISARSLAAVSLFARVTVGVFAIRTL